GQQRQRDQPQRLGEADVHAALSCWPSAGGGQLLIQRAAAAPCVSLPRLSSPHRTPANFTRSASRSSLSSSVAAAGSAPRTRTACTASVLVRSSPTPAAPVRYCRSTREVRTWYSYDSPR